MVNEKWLVSVRCGKYTSTMTADAANVQEAEREIAGIVLCGGNVWDTSDGYIPDSVIDEEFVEFVTVPVKKFPLASFVILTEG